MSVTGVEILRWKPITNFGNCLPHRVHFSEWTFKLDSREFVPQSNEGEYTLIDHGPEFQSWLEEYKVGPHQIVYWGVGRSRWEAANDEVHTEWSFCFEREIDAILFKLKWV